MIQYIAGQKYSNGWLKKNLKKTARGWKTAVYGPERIWKMKVKIKVVEKHLDVWQCGLSYKLQGWI